MTNMTVIDCDGSWAYVGQRNTDWLTWAYWDGQKWKGEPHIGTTLTGMGGPCYDVEGMKARGLSDTMAVHAQACVKEVVLHASSSQRRAHERAFLGVGKLRPNRRRRVPRSLGKHQPLHW